MNCTHPKVDSQGQRCPDCGKDILMVGQGVKKPLKLIALAPK